MQSETSLFAVQNKTFYEDTPYFAVTIKINTGCDITNNITLIVNSDTGHVNLTKLFQDLQDSVRAKHKNFIDFRILRSTMTYVDAYSLIKYGHVHYTYEGKNIYGISDDEFLSTPLNEIHIIDKLINKGKVVKTSLISEAPEIYGEVCNGYPNEIKGQYGDYHLITKMMNYISPRYEVINNEFISFILPILSEKDSDLITAMENPTIKIQAELAKEDIKTQLSNHTINPENPVDDKELKAIMSIDNATKGKKAEKWALEYFKKYFPDIVSCADTPYSCDLFSNESSLRIEVKCHDTSVKSHDGINKFHRDCYVHREDTNIFMYLDLSLDSIIKPHIEINPFRIYITIKSLNDDFMSILKETTVSINKPTIVEDVSKRLYSNLIIHDTRQIYKEELTKDFHDLYLKIEDSFMLKLNTMLGLSQEEQAKQKENPPKIKLPKIEIVGSTERINRYGDYVKEFVESNSEKFIVGVYVKSAYQEYLEWCHANSKQTLLNREFNEVIKQYCDNKRISTDPYTKQKTNVHYWVLK